MKRQQKYFNLETFDYTPYARELTEEEMYLVNGGRRMIGDRTNESEYVSSRPASSNESGSSSGTSTTSNSTSNSVPAATQTTTSSSQQNNTESQSQTSSAPTCTAAQMAAAQGAAMNAYFAEQDKKREENNKQQNSSGSSSSSSSSQSSQIQHNTNDQYIMAQKDYDEHYGKTSSETTTSSSDSSTVYTNSVTSSTSHKDEPVPGQNISGTAMEDLLMWGDAFGKRKDALTPAEQAEMARQDAEIKKNTIDTKVWIVRDDDGLGNEFNATRYIYKNGKLVYQDVIGANAILEDWSKTNADSTTPDGMYYLTNKGTDYAPLEKQEDGTVNSNSFKNVLSLRTRDGHLSEREREAVNCGDRYLHADEKYDKDTNTLTQYSKYNHPCGAGCMISHTQQAHDKMMRILMDGVYCTETIQVNIVSLSNL